MFPLIRTNLMPLVVALTGMTGTITAQVTSEDVNWSSNFFAAANRDSTGGRLDGRYTFHLGVFHGAPAGWEPTAANTAQWAQYWKTADAVSYNTLTSNFSSSYTAKAQVEGVSLGGKRGYVWSCDRGYPAAEWMLLTNPLWIWPSAGSTAPGGFSTTWTVDGSSAIVGQVGQVGQGGVHLRTAAVLGSLPPLLRWEMWREAHFTPGEIVGEDATVSGWQADPNGNGRTNLVEFAFGTEPRTARVDGAPVEGTMEVGGERYLTLGVARDPNAAVVITAEVSSDLVSWYSAGTHVTLEQETPGSLMFRKLTPMSGSNPFGAMRLRVSLP